MVAKRNSNRSWVQSPKLLPANYNESSFWQNNFISTFGTRRWTICALCHYATWAKHPVAAPYTWDESRILEWPECWKGSCGSCGCGGAGLRGVITWHCTCDTSRSNLPAICPIRCNRSANACLWQHWTKNIWRTGNQITSEASQSPKCLPIFAGYWSHWVYCVTSRHVLWPSQQTWTT